MFFGDGCCAWMMFAWLCCRCILLIATLPTLLLTTNKMSLFLILFQQPACCIRFVPRYYIRAAGMCVAGEDDNDDQRHDVDNDVVVILYVCICMNV
jgi:hypothetical protein